MTPKVHKRSVYWARVSEPSGEPQSWSEFEVNDTADNDEVRQQLLLDSSFANPPELRLKSEKGGWRKWKTCQTLPPGDLYIKVVCQKPGQFDVLIFPRYHLQMSISQLQCSTARAHYKWLTVSQGCSLGP